MTTKQEQALSLQGKLAKRIELSAALLERMGISTEAYERVVLNALIRNPDLQRVDSSSMDVAVADCIQAGLIPDGKQAAIIPMAGKAVFWPMMEGRVSLARRGTPGLSVVTEVVYEDDEFRVIGGSKRELIHEPKLNADKRDEKVVAVYAMVQVPGGQWEWEVFDRSDIARYRACSRSDNVWKSNFVEMAKARPIGAPAQTSTQRPSRTRTP